MDSKQHDISTELAELYDESVKYEREARQALQSLPPGSPERARAWQDWSKAIVSTNHAWRRLSASRAALPGHASA